MSDSSSMPRISLEEFDRSRYLKTYRLIREHYLHTVCIEADCPNRYGCFADSTATFLILGDTCTRDCKYCAIRKGVPAAVDFDEPGRIVSAIKELRIAHAVITCVTRDDLADCGGSQFERVIQLIKEDVPGCRIEVLISDLKGERDTLFGIIRQGPDVLNHNIEVVRELFPIMRPKGDYLRSLAILRMTKEIDPAMLTKSGLMVGLGETEEQVKETCLDLRRNGCDFLTIGQYLQPTIGHAPVKRYYTQKDFDRLKGQAEEMGFRHVISGPLVRSSYHAKECLREANYG